MNKAAIAKTAMWRYDPDEKCYIVQSPLFERCIGAAPSKQEAWKIFDELLGEFYVAYLEGKLVGYARRGRPAKGYVELHAQVKRVVKDEIATRAKDLGISQGEVIEYLCRVEEVKDDLEKRVEQLEERIEKQRKLDSRRRRQKTSQ